MARAKKTRKKKPVEAPPELNPKFVLQDWRVLVRWISKMTEEQLQAALDAELNGEKRSDIVFRLHRRLSKVRQERELQEIINGNVQVTA